MNTEKMKRLGTGQSGESGESGDFGESGDSCESGDSGKSSDSGEYQLLSLWTVGRLSFTN